METTQTTEIATDYSLIETTSVIPENSTLLLVTDDPVKILNINLLSNWNIQGKGALILNETLTDLNVTTTEYIPIVAAATAFASLIAIGAFAVTIFIIVLIRGRKRFQEVT